MRRTLDWFLVANRRVRPSTALHLRAGELVRRPQRRDQGGLVHCIEIAASDAHAPPTARHRAKGMWRQLAKEVSEILIEHEVEVTSVGIERRKRLARRTKCQPMPMGRLTCRRQGESQVSDAVCADSHHLTPTGESGSVTENGSRLQPHPDSIVPRGRIPSPPSLGWGPSVWRALPGSCRTACGQADRAPGCSAAAIGVPSLSTPGDRGLTDLQGGTRVRRTRNQGGGEDARAVGLPVLGWLRCGILCAALSGRSSRAAPPGHYPSRLRPTAAAATAAPTSANAASRTAPSAGPPVR